MGRESSHRKIELAISGPSVHPITVVRVYQIKENLAAALSTVFDLEWPLVPNRAASRPGVTVLWLSPQEWAVVGLEGAEVAALSTRALAPSLYHVSVVTDAYVSFHVDGLHSRQLIAKGCSLDLHPLVFLPDSCAQSLLAGCFVILHRSAQSDAFNIIVDTTLSQYFEAWLSDARG